MNKESEEYVEHLRRSAGYNRSYYGRHKEDPEFMEKKRERARLRRIQQKLLNPKPPKEEKEEKEKPEKKAIGRPRKY